MDDSDILSFGHTGKISFKAALRSVRAHRPNFVTPIALDSSSQSSDYNDSDESSHCRDRSRKRVHVHQVGGKSGSLASKLIHHQLEPYLISSDSDDSDVDSNTRWFTVCVCVCVYRGASIYQCTRENMESMLAFIYNTLFYTVHLVYRVKKRKCGCIGT